MATRGVPATISEALRLGEAYLAGTTPTTQLDVRLLVQHIAGVDRAGLIRDADRLLTDSEVAAWLRCFADRAAGRPIAQITGEWEFYSLPVFVDEHVLVPRPETELLVDWAKEVDRDRPVETVVDVGTGSGCIAIAIATELTHCRVLAIDISREALAVARRNLDRHGLTARIDLACGSLLEPVGSSVDLIVSNPPYVEPGDPKLEENVRRFEPDAALYDRLDGDGLGYYRRLARAAGDVLAPGGSLLVEVGETQADAVVELFDESSWETEVRRDLAGIQRAVRCRRWEEA